jgi:pyruvate formate lyase activating enzyme
MAGHRHTPPATLTRARDIARGNGLQYVYTGNVRDTDGGSTYCPACNARVIERDGSRIGDYRITNDGHCAACGTTIPGVFNGPAGTWGARRGLVRMANV